MSESLLNRICVSSRPYNENPNVIGVIVAVTIIALAGIAIVAAAAAASLLLVQSASATTDVMTTPTSSVGGEQERVVHPVKYKSK
jgi:hypothetical protein